MLTRFDLKAELKGQIWHSQKIRRLWFLLGCVTFLSCRIFHFKTETTTQIKLKNSKISLSSEMMCRFVIFYVMMTSLYWTIRKLIFASCTISVLTSVGLFFVNLCAMIFTPTALKGVYWCNSTGLWYVSSAEYLLPLASVKWKESRVCKPLLPVHNLYTTKAPTVPPCGNTW